MKNSNKTCVVLLSGGIDSVTTLYYALDKGYVPHALIFDYGQRHKKEIRCAVSIAEMTGTAYRIVNTRFDWVPSSLTDRKISLPLGRDLSAKDIPLTYVGGRNIIFLSYAFSLAESLNAGRVLIGAHVQDYSGYPDCRPEFLKKFQAAANEGMKKKSIKLTAPLIRMNKRQIISLGFRLGVPFDSTWSCYSGRRLPCLKCDSCRFRTKAFESLGKKDPLLVS